MPKKKIKKKKSISQLKKEADRVFSLFVRNRDKACFTCGARENLQCGHFVSRSHNNTRYDPDNSKTQCVSCNVFKNGNYAEYAFRLGGEKVAELRKRGRILKQFKRFELEEIIKKYKV